MGWLILNSVFTKRGIRMVDAVMAADAVLRFLVHVPRKIGGILT
jgi:hypothetical protein